MNENSPPRFDYSRRPSMAWASRHRRLLVGLAIVFAIAIPLYRNRTELSRRAAWLYWSHRCASHVMPGVIDLMELDPQRAAERVAGDHDWIFCTPDPTSSSVSPLAIYVPQAWRELSKLDGRSDLVDIFHDEKEPIVFLGSLCHRGDRESRLVIIKGSATNGLDLLAYTRVLVLPHPKWNEPVPRSTGNRGFVYSGQWRPAALRGGVVDPADSSHLVLKFVVYDIRERKSIEATGEIDAYLEDDDSMTFVLRQSPELDEMRVSLRLTKMRSIMPR